MTTKHDHQGTRTTNKGALTKFQRIAARAQKSAVRKLARQAAKKLDFEKLANHPLYRRLEPVFLDQDLKKQLAACGFESALEVAAFKSIAQVEEQAKVRGGQVPNNPFVLVERARGAVRKLVAQVRNIHALHDPVNTALRHSSRSISPTMEQSLRETGTLRYVRPESIQSEQSFAAYLKDIYDLAKTEITMPEGPFQLDKRRPDLKDVVLSDDNLKKEITTLELVNEVLSAQLESHNVDLEVTKTRFYPLALPYHAEHDEMREALMQMGDLNLNELARRTTPNDFAIDESTFTLVPNSADALGLLGDNQVGTNIWSNEKRLLSTGVTQGSVLTTRDLYGYPTADEGADQTNRHALGLVSNFCARSELSFDAFCQLYRQYGVKDDSGTSATTLQYGGHFITWDQDLILLPRQADGELQIVGKQEGYAPYPVLRSMHFLIRLQRRTGIAFHELDWLLQVPGTASNESRPNYEDAAFSELREPAFDVLAHYLYYQQSFGMDADEFVALLWRINPYYRVDFGEQSQLKRLFGDDAALVRQSTLAGTTAFSSLNTSELGDVLRRGLQVTSTEWQAMVARIDPAGKTMLNERTLARLYRLVRVMRLVEWDIVQGLALVDLCENGLSSDLIADIADDNNPGSVLSALDRLVHLSRWMKDANLSVSALTAILTPAASIQNKLQSTEQARTWLRGLQQVLVTPRVKEADLFAFRTWSTGSPATSQVIEPATWMSALQEKGVLDAYGVLAPVSRADIEKAITEILQAQVGQTPNESIAPLTDCLLRAGEGQRDALAGQIVQLQPGSVVDVVGPMLLWMSQYANAPLSTQFVVQTLLAWDYPNPSVALGALPQLELCHDLRRYLGAIQTLGLGAIDVALVAEAPKVLQENLQGTSARLLGQLFYVHRFKALQNNIANADAWASYLVLANSEQSPSTELRGQLNAMLALFLDCPQADIEGWLGAGVAKTVEALDTLSRRVAQAKTMCQSASELQAVLALNVSQKDYNGATRAARAAAVGALHRYEGGARAAAFRNAIAERKRDALVALYMAKVVAPDTSLAARVKDTETLYEYLLLDVNVTSAVPTSRLVEACSSVQVFVNRALAGLEPGANIADREALKREWEIASHYRVWEANKKLERYPGNYIEPELRYEKSPLFQSLEGALGSGEINEETIETAVYQYMEGLQRIAELTVCGFSKEELPGDRLTFHFVARSNWEKAQYYYRAVVIDLTDDRLKDPAAWRKALTWEPWQQIQISPTNPVISDMAVCRAWNRLFFFWMELEESMDNEGAKFYTLRPQYLRTRLNGLTGDVLSPRSKLKEADTRFTTVPVLETRHPCFDGNSIKMEYRIPVPNSSPKIYGVSVNSKVAEIVAVTSNSFDVSTQVVAGFQSIASLDGSVTVGDREYVFSPSAGGTLKAATQFLADYTGLVTGGDSATWRISLKNDLQIEFKYKPQGTLGTLEFTLGTNSLLGDLIDSASGHHAYDVEMYFTTGNTLTPLIVVGGPNGQSQTIRMDSLIPVSERFKSDDGGMIALPIQSQTKTFPLPDAWWSEPKTVPLKLSVAFHFEHKADVLRTIDWSCDGKANPCICSTASCSASLSAIQETTPPHALSFYETGDLGSEAYLYFSNAPDWSPTDGYVSLLYSEAMAQLARSLPVSEGRTLLDELFKIDNQSLSEGNVDDFCKKLYTALKTSSTNGCKPETELAFDGAFGLYAWEVFYHIPSLVASRYVEQGNYDAAARWFQAIYDPSKAPSWNVLPLRQCVDQSGAAPSEGITDPDELAMDNPAFYQQATIRQVLEATLAAGDNAYRQETQESLQQAKLLYVSGKRLFGAELGDELETSTKSDWKNPTLGSVQLTDFHPPYNQELRDFYATFEERLYNLRHWLSIDGQPLNIPLLAAPIDPRALQLVGQSRSAAPPKTEAASSPSPYPFEVILAKAQGYVKNLQSMSTRLLDALEKKDDRELAMIVQSEALSGLETQIELQELKLEEALKAKEIADAQLEEAVAETEHEEEKKYLTVDNVKLAVEKTRLAWKNGALNTKRLTLEVSTMASALIPKIAGLAFGGMAPQESFLGNLLGVIHEKQDLQSEKEDVAEEEVSYKEQFENEYNALKAARKMAELERAVERADLLVQQEERALEVLKKQRESGENVMHFMTNRLTNTEFYGWYVGQLASLYQASYDATLSMCRMAERALGEQTPITATFVRANWNGNYMGLLAADSLALDLQRMDLAFTQYMMEADDQTNTYSAGLDDTRTIDNQRTVLDALLEYGEAEFELTEEMFDEYGPHEVDRRIQYVRVQFPDLQRVGKLPHAKLTQVSNRRYPGRDRDPSKAVNNVLAMQTLVLNGAETDTRTQGRSGRRLGVFQGTGTHSTWRLSIPGVVHALAQKRGTNAHHVMLKKLVREIVLEIGYTARHR